MRRLLFFLVLFCVVSLQAQTFSGDILMRDNSNMYLNQVYVTNLKTQKTVLSDYNGRFSIAASPGDMIRFTSIVTERKDVKLTPQNFQNRNLIELKIAYYEIQEVILSKFKPTGNLTYDVKSLNKENKVEKIKKIVGLPEPKGDGKSPKLPIADFRDGGLTFSLESIFDVLSGERKKKERLEAYENMMTSTAQVKEYLGKEYFEKIKIPENLVDNFLQFVYSSDNLGPYIQRGNFEIVKVSIEKYLPIYQRRLKNSNLLEIITSSQENGTSNSRKQ